MSNITTFPSSRVVSEPVKHFDDDSELYFDTWERPAFFQGNDIGNYYGDSNHKHIVRMYNGAPKSLGIVGKNYKMLHNKELCQSIEQQFVESMSNDQLEGVQVKDNISYYGATSIRQYIFPNITADIGSDRSNVALRTIIVNGYDGSSSFKLYNGAIDFFCANGMVTGIYDVETRRHTAGLTIPSLVDKIKKSIDIFYLQAEHWKHWVGKEISDEDAQTCYEAIPNASEGFVKKLLRQFHIECLTHGRTVWALYSAATYYATHDEGEFKTRATEHDHSASTLINREKQIRSWISGDEFVNLAA
tara:strand:+ start:450 stop:1358 length:909 start_codon:yes stop_codon:yes gene_type:complete